MQVPCSPDWDTGPLHCWQNHSGGFAHGQDAATTGPSPATTKTAVTARITNDADPRPNSRARIPTDCWCQAARPIYPAIPSRGVPKNTSPISSSYLVRRSQAWKVQIHRHDSDRDFTPLTLSSWLGRSEVQSRSRLSLAMAGRRRHY
jgi:hypothetical protein